VLHDEAMALIQSIPSWVSDTATLLRELSPAAAASFEHDAKGLRREIKRLGYMPSTAYVDLTEWLNRLQAIIDNADRYV